MTAGRGLIAAALGASIALWCGSGTAADAETTATHETATHAAGDQVDGQAMLFAIADELEAMRRNLEAREQALDRRAAELDARESRLQQAEAAPTQGGGDTNGLVRELQALINDLRTKATILEQRLDALDRAPAADAPPGPDQDSSLSGQLRSLGFSTDPASRATLAAAHRGDAGVDALLDAVPSVSIRTQVEILHTRNPNPMRPAVGLFRHGTRLRLHSAPNSPDHAPIPPARAVLVLLEDEETGWLGVMSGTEPGFIDPSTLVE